MVYEGISVCGSGAGTFVLAPLASLLLHHYGWEGATRSGIYRQM